VTCPTDIMQGATASKTRHPQPAVPLGSKPAMRFRRLSELCDRRRYAAQLRCPQSSKRAMQHRLASANAVQRGGRRGRRYSVSTCSFDGGSCRKRDNGYFGWIGTNGRGGCVKSKLSSKGAARSSV
jgi:hypothetical protein